MMSRDAPSRLCCTTLKFFLLSALNVLLFLTLMTSRLQNLLSIVLPQWNCIVLNNCCLECCVQWAEQSRTREGKRALNLGFICRSQTRYIQYCDEGLDLFFFASAFGEKFAFFCTNTSSEKLVDKWNWHQMHHVGHDKLAHAQWKSRLLLAEVSLLFGIGGTNCSQGTYTCRM